MYGLGYLAKSHFQRARAGMGLEVPGSEGRFSAYVEELVCVISYADRAR
jgi:hypothetical protein